MKFFYNVMKTWTGRDLTTVSSNPIHAADVFVANTNSSPVIVEIATLTVLETRFHQGSVTNINGSAGAWVAFGGGAALANDTKKILLTSTMGEPLEFGVGASAGAAQRVFVINRGDGPISLELVLDSGDEIWVRSLTTSGVTSGELTMSILGLAP